MARVTLQSRFGTVVRELRNRMDISQEELAHRAGLHRTYVSLLERGLRNPSLLVIQALSRVLKVSMAEMMRFVEKGE